ncbi:hypothetical protein RhiirA4_464149 [Rhizophagus irregularis]|uniref:Uncharacterized protein n=1 Tax=Rhizophagus irregularis TaxID=588596 RepID=A0A2I1GPF2_9GLOM|nr:hypothetical protein RhiirA4_464149 [Rhizophagus irregularis]
MVKSEQTNTPIENKFEIAIGFYPVLDSKTSIVWYDAKVYIIKYRGEFIGFSKEYTAAKAMEITTPFNPKSAFKQSPDKIIMEFQCEADFSTCII